MTAISKPITPNIPFSNLELLHQDIASELQQALARVLSSGWFVLGKELTAFEQEFANYIGSKHCIGVGNGLDALVLILKALDIGPSDEVIVPTHTFIATWLAVSQVGATPIPVLTDEYHGLDANLIKSVITSKTKAIIAVHLYGHPTDMDAVSEAIGQRPIHLIEDAAQAHGAIYKGKKAGNLGIAAGFSFYPGKNLGALGDGGCITTNDDALAHKIRMIRNYGSVEKYEHRIVGVNSRLDELQAAFLRAKLPLLDHWNKRRSYIAALYKNKLSNCKTIALPREADWATAVWHQFVIRTKQREALRAYLAQHGIQTLIHYPIANHKQHVYSQKYGDNNTYVAYEDLTAEILSLPMCPTLSDEQVLYICDVIMGFE